MSKLATYKPLIAVGLTGIILVAIAGIFSSEKASAWLDKHQLHFVNYKSVKSQFSPKIETKSATPVVAKKLVDTSISVEVRKKIDTLRKQLHFLENLEITGRETALGAFFASLTTTADQTIHIWYYGDSQVEGDRITGELRQLLQARFSGNGAGYLPFSDPSTYRFFELKTGKSLTGINCFTTKRPKGFGFAGKVYRFTNKDSNSSQTTGVWISPQLQYDALYLLCGNCKGGKGSISLGDSTRFNFELPVGVQTTAINLNVRNGHGKLNLTLPGGADYYGLMFDCNKGIQVDNCGIRGHSGDGLLHIDDNVIVEAAKRWKTGLVVFHFGNNMIPVIKPGEKNMEYYSKYFEKIFSRYKKLLPQASMLVVGAGDMGTTVNGEEVPYPNVEEFVVCMKKAAFNAGCAYFDAHAMIAKDGGILGWKRKGWAGLDGHLTPKGQMIYANNIYEELMREYEVYQLIHPSH